MLPPQGLPLHGALARYCARTGELPRSYREPAADRPALRAWMATVLGILLLAATGCAPAAQPGSVPPTQSPRPAAASPATSPAGNPAGVASPTAQVHLWTFDADAAGGLPPGAEVFSGTWAVRAEADAPSPPNALCQTGTAEFPALALGDGAYVDLLLSARFEPVAGKEDQAAGLIFRIQDQGNYYILRANALEGNVNFYKYQGSRRSILKDSKAEVPSGLWQGLRLEVRGNTYRGFLNGQQVVEATDDTFKAAGRVGLWTKADSVTCFDDVEVQPL
jgi:Domain of Unknown Function (DUF1080)